MLLNLSLKNGNSELGDLSTSIGHSKTKVLSYSGTSDEYVYAYRWVWVLSMSSASALQEENGEKVTTAVVSSRGGDG